MEPSEALRLLTTRGCPLGDEENKVTQILYVRCVVGSGGTRLCSGSVLIKNACYYKLPTPIHLHPTTGNADSGERDVRDEWVLHTDSDRTFYSITCTHARDTGADGALPHCGSCPRSCSGQVSASSDVYHRTNRPLCDASHASVDAINVLLPHPVRNGIIE